MFTCLPLSLGKMIQSWLQPPSRRYVLPFKKTKPNEHDHSFFLGVWMKKWHTGALGCSILSMISIETDTISWHDPSDLTSILVHVYVAGWNLGWNSATGRVFQISDLHTFFLIKSHFVVEQIFRESRNGFLFPATRKPSESKKGTGKGKKGKGKSKGDGRFWVDCHSHDARRKHIDLELYIIKYFCLFKVIFYFLPRWWR